MAKITLTRSNAFKVLYNGDTFIGGTVSADPTAGMTPSFLSNIPPPTLFHYRDLANKPFEFNSCGLTLVFKLTLTQL